MNVEQDFVTTAALIGEPARAAMLWNLLDGKAYTASELAIAANISAQSASNHLNKLLEANLLKVEKQGRHRYYAFARPEVAYAIEALANLAAPQKTRIQQQAAVQLDIQYCRTCYDHLAGKVGVSITQALVNQSILQEQDADYLLSDAGRHWFEQLGVKVEAPGQIRRSFARKCLDWSERELHLAGYLGAQLLHKMLELNWLRRVHHSRAMLVTGEGRKNLYTHLRLEV